MGNEDWTAATFAGNRRRQHEEFRALSFRDKLLVLEQLAEVAEYFQSRRRRRAASPESGAGPATRADGASSTGHRAGPSP